MDFFDGVDVNKLNKKSEEKKSSDNKEKKMEKDNNIATEKTKGKNEAKSKSFAIPSDVTIDGNVLADGHNILVSGKVTGDVSAEVVAIAGEIGGKISADAIFIKSDVEGDIQITNEDVGLTGRGDVRPVVTGDIKAINLTLTNTEVVGNIVCNHLILQKDSYVRGNVFKCSSIDFKGGTLDGMCTLKDK